MTQLFAVALMAQLVSVNVPPKVSEEATLAALSSCSLVLSDLGEGQCVLHQNGRDLSYEVDLEVTENPKGLQVSIELSAVEAGQRRIRVLSFHDRSSEQERWQAVGLVIAALVDAEVKRERPLKVEPDPVQKAVPSPPPPAISSGVSVLLEVGGLVRQESSLDFLSGGGLLRGTMAGKKESLGFTVALGGLAGTSPVQQLGFRPSLGLHLSRERRGLRLAFRAEALAMVTRWSAEDAFASDERWHTRIGVGLSPTLFLPLSPQLGTFLGFSATALFPPVRVIVRGEEVGLAPVFGGEGHFGLWARFGP